MNRPPSLGVYRVEERALRPPTEPNGNPGLFPASVGEDVDVPGDAAGFEVIEDPAGQLRSFATMITPSPWSGYPSSWPTPPWGSGLGSRYNELVDVAWAGLDLTSSVLSTMPPYLVERGEVIPPTAWVENPDPDLYTSWEEFAKQLFWSYGMGEAYVLPTAYLNGLPARFHVVEPWLVNAEMDSGRRRFRIGSLDVTDEILPIRYKSTTEDARGHGPLEVGQSRVIAAGVLSRYVTNLASSGGIPHSVIKAPGQLTQKQADDLLAGWFEARMNHLGLPAVLSGGVEIETLQVSPRDMALLDLSQYNDSRIAVLLQVPPFLLGLPSGGDSMTYSNVSSLFDFWWRSGLRTKTRPVMAALSQWALPQGQRIEVNSDEFVRPGFAERVSAWSTLHGIEDETGRAISAAEIRAGERLNGEQATAIMTGGI